MDSQQKTIVSISIAVVVLLAFLGVISKKNNGIEKEGAGKTQGGEIGITENAGAFTPLVPKDAKPTLPAESSPANEETGETFGIYALEITNTGFSPNAITVKKGDVVQLRVTAKDRDYDFTIPYIGIYKKISRGTEEMVSFGVTDSGTFAFGCVHECPRAGREGSIIVIPK